MKRNVLIQRWGGTNYQLTHWAVCTVFNSISYSSANNSVTIEIPTSVTAWPKNIVIRPWKSDIVPPGANNQVSNSFQQMIENLAKEDRKSL